MTNQLSPLTGYFPHKTQPVATYSETVENYLRVIAMLEDESVPVTPTQLRNVLKVAFPTVSATLKRMSSEGLLCIEDGNSIRLTPVGSVAAECVMRRHRLTERLLVDVLHVPWSQVYAFADSMEHTISPRVERQIQLFLNNPQCCPHGNPVRRCLGEDQEASLAYVSPGQVKVRRIREKAAVDQDLMRWIERNDVLPDRCFQVCAGAADFVFLVDSTGHRISVPLRVAEAIVVTHACE